MSQSRFLTLDIAKLAQLPPAVWQCLSDENGKTLTNKEAKRLLRELKQAGCNVLHVNRPVKQRSPKVSGAQSTQFLIDIGEINNG